jgi:hypothetical protein
MCCTCSCSTMSTCGRLMRTYTRRCRYSCGESNAPRRVPPDS